MTNNSKNVIAFKIKTTAPKAYCVRPNGGLIEPNDEKQVQSKIIETKKKEEVLVAMARDLAF